MEKYSMYDARTVCNSLGIVEFFALPVTDPRTCTRLGNSGGVNVGAGWKSSVRYSLISILERNYVSFCIFNLLICLAILVLLLFGSCFLFILVFWVIISMSEQ